MDPLVWAALLLVVGFALVSLEVFVPTGGLLGVLSITAILAAISLAFYNSGLTAGFAFLLITAVGLPVVLGLAFRWLPETKIGRRLLPHVPTSREVLPDSEERRQLRALVGKIGQAKTLMLPSGSVLIEGRTIDAVSEGMPIEPGHWVRVIEVRGTRVVVGPVQGEPPRPTADDLLSRPYDSLGGDPFQE